MWWDELGALYLPRGPLKKRHEILGRVEHEAAEAEVTFAGRTHVVTVSARANEPLAWCRCRGCTGADSPSRLLPPPRAD